MKVREVGPTTFQTTITNRLYCSNLFLDNILQVRLCQHSQEKHQDIISGWGNYKEEIQELKLVLKTEHEHMPW